MRPLVVVVALFTVVAPLAGATAAFGADAGGAPAESAETADDVTITVAVVDSNGNGIGDATVTVSWDGGNDTGETEPNGETLVTVPDDERLEFTVEHPDYVRNFPKTVRNVAVDQTITVAMTPPASETVTVLEPDGDPVEDAQVSLRKTNQPRSVVDGRTDTDGTFTAEGIEEGEYYVSVLQSGYDRQRVTVNVTGDSAHNVTIRSNETQVNFRVTDGRLDEGIDARVSVRTGGEEVLSFRTGDNGRLRQFLPVNTDYTVVVQRDEYEDAEAEIDVDEEPMSVELSINRTDSLSLTAETNRVLAGNSLRVTVTDEYDEAVEGATITLDGEAVATTNEDGEATVRLEDPGDYRLVASDDAVDSDPVNVTAASAATTTAEPTTVAPTTAEPTTAAPTTAEPTTAATTTTDPATLTETPADATTTGGGGGGGGAPGFLVVTALGGLLGGLLALRHWRR